MIWRPKIRPSWSERKLIAQKHYIMVMQKQGYDIHSDKFKEAYTKWNEQYDVSHPRYPRRKK